MKILKRIFFIMFVCFSINAHAYNIFSEDEPVVNGLNVIDMSESFADIFQKLDSIKWAGKSINIAIESLEGVNPKAHIASTDERVVLVWGDEIIANYPKPAKQDWRGIGEIVTALVLKLREYDPYLAVAGDKQIYQIVVDGVMHSIDESGHYIESDTSRDFQDGKLLTSVGIQGGRDERGNFRVTGIFKGSPADISGIRAGDLIAEINGTLTADMTDGVLQTMMSGFNSGTLKMLLLTPGGQRYVVVRRATIVLADADVVYMDDNNGGILNIIVNRVSDNAVSIINNAIQKHPNIHGVMLDLRAASGDDERAAARMAGLFLGKKPIMRIVETASDEIEVVSANTAVIDVPVVTVLSNTTTGTAEALAGAFYENSRSVLIGTPTAGKAKIASRIVLNNGSFLELLNKSIKTANGGMIDKRGIFPIVCLSNIRSSSQQNAFFLNLMNNDFNAQDFNSKPDVDADVVRRGCPVITSGTDEDSLAIAVSVKLLTDKVLYNKLLLQ